MNRISWLAVCVCACAAVAVHAQGVTVAVVDMEELVRLHPNTASDNKLLEETVKDFRAENDDLRQKLEAMQEDFEKIRRESIDPALSEKARKSAEERAGKAREALVAADRNAREKMQSRQEQLTEMHNRMVKKTVNELRTVIGKYADERKIQLVLPANQMVYNDKMLDITDAILKQMNVQRPPKESESASAARESAGDPLKSATALPVTAKPLSPVPASVPLPAPATSK